MDKFNVGDKVILTNPKQASGHDLEEGWIGYVFSPNDGDALSTVYAEDVGKNGYYFEEDELELIGVGRFNLPRNAPPESVKEFRRIMKNLGGSEPEHTGGSVDYYKVYVANPTTLDQPYYAEANDIIESLGLTFAEGNLLKAVWRIAADRNGKKKKGNNSVYDAEKLVFFAQRVLAQEKGK